jgi:hypothetical protein
VNSATIRPIPACWRHARKTLAFHFNFWVIGLLAVFCLALSQPALGDFNVDPGSPTVTITLSGVIFFDANHDGQFNNDYAIAGGEIDLFSNSSLVASTTVSKTGQYSFSGLTPGTYTIKNKTSATWQATPGQIKDINGNWLTTGLGTASSDNTQISNIVLSAGDDAELYNFGAQYYPIQLLSKRMLTASSDGDMLKAVPEPSAVILLLTAAFAVFAGASVIFTAGRRNRKK